MLPARWPAWVRTAVALFFVVLAAVVLIGLMIIPFFLGPPQSAP